VSGRPDRASISDLSPPPLIIHPAPLSAPPTRSNLYNTALICRLVLTWFPNPPEFISTPLATVCDPYLNLFRGIIPPLGGTLDLSPILAFLTLNVRRAGSGVDRGGVG
jgi:uncharacterized protein YggT (Ycf19 family)